jgi:PAS domain S-box-containing protein
MDQPPEPDTATQSAVRQQEVIAEFGQKALKTDDIDQLLSAASTAVAEALDTDYVSVLKLVPGDDEAVLTQGIGWRDGRLGSTTLSAAPDSQLGHTLRTAEPVVVDDVRTDTRFDAPEPIADHDVVSSIGVTVGSAEDPWGVLETHTTDPREFTGRDGTFVQSIANLLASAVEAFRTRDELTEIYGRISDAVFGLNREWEFTHLNERAHDIINPEGRELEGNYVWDEFPDATTRKFKPKYERAMYEQETVSFEEHYPAPLDAWFDVRAYPSETGLSVYFRDITERKQREQELAQYESIIETIDDGVYVVDEENRFVTVNDAYVEMFGYDREELLGEPASLIAGEDVAEAARHLADEMRRGDVDAPTIEAELPTADGDRISAEAKFSLFSGVAGREYRVGVVRDITERTAREEQIAERERALERVYEIIADDESVFEQLDALLAAVRDHLGTEYATFSHIDSERYEFERVSVAPGIDLEAGHTTERTELQICERVFQTGDSLVINDVAAEAPELADPEWEIACYLGAPVVVDGDPYGTFCFYDVEPRSEPFSDWDLTFVELLSDWVGSELTQRQTTEQLQRQNERLEEFASIVSHDLRNPLNVAEGRLELARDECDSEHLHGVEKAHTRIGTLIEDLLALARDGDEATECAPIDLSTLIDDCWATVETGDATLVTDTDRTVLADRNRLKQLFENLIRNAVEHGGDTVTVTVGALENGFYIEDDGPGVPDAERDEVFEHGFSTNTDGTGFGLSIVEQVVTAHDWAIHLSESETGGARFEITGVEFADR